ncbi:UTRA domain-containing protein [Nonomuraea sp. NPDC050783]|uniref:UTRA domain-containing protein n=1 Tax=Nonomuraea sp. NPDC050783 TaxID=3154634 RepID=UPI0034652FBC
MSDTGWASVSTPYVRPRRPGDRDAWTEEAEAHGHAGTNQLLGVEEIRPPRAVADVLGLGTGLAEARKIPGGAVTLLAELGFRPHKVEERITARPPAEPERAALGLGPLDWVLVLTRVSRTSAGTPYEAAVMTMIADGRELRYEMTIGKEI